MIPANDKITHRQLFAVITVALLSPLARRIPGLLAYTAGNAAWLAVVIAALPLIVMIVYLGAFLRTKREGYGLREMIPSILGNIFGKIVLFLISLWLVFFSSFLLRNGADRFISTIYPNSRPTIFIICMAAVCLVAALGQLKALARSAMIFRPILIGVFLLILAFSFGKVDLSGMWLVDTGEIIPLGRAALITLNTLSAATVFLFVEDSTTGKFETKTFGVWLFVLLIIIELLVLCCIGMFGPSLTANMIYPFFALARETSILGVLERTESLIIGIWVFADFVFISMLLFIATRNIKYCFGISESEEKLKIFDLSHGKWIAILCAVASAVTGMLIAPSTVALKNLSESIIPVGNAALNLALLPLIFIIGKLRKKI